MTLRTNLVRDEIRRLADETEAYCALSSMHKYSTDRIESAILEGVKLVLEPLQLLVELKDIKERIESGTATQEMNNYYRQNKELAWKMARDAVRQLTKPTAP